MRRVFLLVAAALIGGGAVLRAQDDSLVAARIRKRLKHSDRVAGEFYLRRSFRPAWSNEQGPNRLADDLVDFFQHDRFAIHRGGNVTVASRLGTRTAASRIAERGECKQC